MTIIENMKRALRDDDRSASWVRMQADGVAKYVAPALLMAAALDVRLGGLLRELRVPLGASREDIVLRRSEFRPARNDSHSHGREGGWSIDEWTTKASVLEDIVAVLTPQKVVKAAVRRWFEANCLSELPGPSAEEDLQLAVLPSLAADDLEVFLNQVVMMTSVSALRGFMADPVGCVAALGWDDPVGKAHVMMAGLKRSGRASPSEYYPHTRDTPLHDWVSWETETRLESLNVILTYGGDLSLLDYASRTPLHAATETLLYCVRETVMANNPTVEEIQSALASVRMLREAGSETNTQNARGRSPADDLRDALKAASGLAEECRAVMLQEITKELAMFP